MEASPIVGKSCYFRMDSGSGARNIHGIVLEANVQTVVVAVSAGLAEAAGGLEFPNFGALRLASNQISLMEPSGWKSDCVAPPRESW